MLVWPAAIRGVGVATEEAGGVNSKGRAKGKATKMVLAGAKVRATRMALPEGTARGTRMALTGVAGARATKMP